MAGLLAPKGRLLVFEHNPATRWVVSRCPFDTGAVLLRPAEMADLMRQAGLRGIGQNYIVFFPAALSFLRPVESPARLAAHGRAILYDSSIERRSDFTITTCNYLR